MADISLITLLDGSSANLKDAKSRQDIASLESDVSSLSSGKVSIAQGLQNANKFLKVGSTGNIELVDASEVGSGDVAGPSSSVDGHIAVFNGTDGKAIKDTGYTILKSVPSDALFTDTTYEAATTSADGLMSAADKEKLDGIATGATANTGTITGITMNGSSVGTSGVVDLGTVITAHQDISGKVNSSLVGAANGIAELDENGKVPSSQLPSYVDDVVEYTSIGDFPVTGESGKIYIDTSTNISYRWSGSTYVQITSSLALGETSATAYRGDRGATAYSHATDASRLTTAQISGLYKIATTAEGHVASTTAVVKSDITALGVPAQDTTYSNATTSNAGLMSSADKTKLDGLGVISTDISATIETTDWLLSDGEYEYTWMNNNVKTNSDIEMFFADGAEDVSISHIKYEKISGGVRCRTNRVPSGDVPVIFRILDMQSNMTNAIETTKADKADTVLTTTLSRGRIGTVGTGSFAFGLNAKATGGYSHAEGKNPQATANYAHAEGSENIASGAASHAEGNYTTASGGISHAEGGNTTASGNYSHAEGQYTIASRLSQHVGGEYNVSDVVGTNGSYRGAYVEIIGNGSDEQSRSNARVLDWSGNEKLKGDIYVNCDADSKNGTALGAAVSALASQIGQKLLYKQVTLSKDTLGTSWTQASRSPGTATDLFGVAASKIVSLTGRNGSFSPSCNPTFGFYNDSLYVASTQTSTLTSGIVFDIVYLP